MSLNTQDIFKNQFSFENFEKLTIEAIINTQKQLKLQNLKEKRKIFIQNNPSLDLMFSTFLLEIQTKQNEQQSYFKEYIFNRKPEEINLALPIFKDSYLVGFGHNLKPHKDVIIFDNIQNMYDQKSLSCSCYVYSQSNIFDNNKIFNLIQEINCVENENMGGRFHLNTIIKNINKMDFSFNKNKIQFNSLFKRSLIYNIFNILLENNETLEKDEIEISKKEFLIQMENWFIERKKIMYEFNLPLITERTMQELRKIENFNIYDQYFSIFSIFFKLKKYLSEEKFYFLINLIIESMMQSQEEFMTLRYKNIHHTFIKNENKRFSIVKYNTKKTDKFPHRAFLNRMNYFETRKDINKNYQGGILVIFNTQIKSTTIFKTQNLSDKIWNNFIQKIIEKENDKWYVSKIKDLNGFFITNKSEFYTYVSKTKLTIDDFQEILKEVIQN